MAIASRPAKRLTKSLGTSLMTTVFALTLLFVLVASPAYADAAAVKSAIEARNLGPASVIESVDVIDATFTLKPGYKAEDVSKNALLVMTFLFENYPTTPIYHVTMMSDGVKLVRFTAKPQDLDGLYFGTLTSDDFWSRVDYELLPGQETAGSGSSAGGVIAFFLFIFASFGIFIVGGIIVIVILYLLLRKKKK